MSRGRIGATGGIVRRKQLKPPRVLSDEEFLARAAASARRAQGFAERQQRADAVDREIRAQNRPPRSL